ncbi:MAG: formate dehydrogenase accessory sulfurtransferase FdhD, partial [Intestinibacter sp.]
MKNRDGDSNINKLVDYEYKESFSLPVIKYEGLEKKDIEENIIAEYPLTLILNDKVYDTFFCHPYNLDDLIIGNLFYRGKIKDKNDILKLDIDKNSGISKAIINENDSCDEKIFINDISYITSNSITNNTVKIDLKTVYEFMDIHLNSSKLFNKTAGVHCAAIYDIKRNKSTIIREDVARHNALDKSIGYCI